MQRINDRKILFEVKYFIRTHPYLKGPVITEGKKYVQAREDLLNTKALEDSVSLTYRIVVLVKNAVQHCEVESITEIPFLPEDITEVLEVPQEFPSECKLLWIVDVKSSFINRYAKS